MHHETQHGEDFRGVTESRAHRRTQVHSLAYIELSDENAGLILNISETGIAVQAVQVFTSNQFPRMRFRLPGTEIPVEAAGRLVWQIRSKKEAGIEFVGLIGTTRTGIRNWIAGEPSRVAAAGKIDPLGALNLSTSPADAKPVARRHVPSTKNSDGGPEDRDTAAGSLLSGGQSRSPGNDSRATTRLSSTPHDGRAAHSPSCRPVADSRAPASPTGGKWTEAPPGHGWRFATGRPQFGNEPDPSLERAHVMPQWKGHVVPGVGMEYRKRRPWWSYTAALGLLAAIGFAGIMMFNPDSLNRARVEALIRGPGASAIQSPSEAKRSAPSSLPGASPENIDSPAPGIKLPRTATNELPTQSEGQSRAQARVNRPAETRSANMENSYRNSTPAQAHQSGNRNAPYAKTNQSPNAIRPPEGASNPSAPNSLAVSSPSGYLTSNQRYEPQAQGEKPQSQAQPSNPTTSAAAPSPPVAQPQTSSRGMTSASLDSPTSVPLTAVPSGSVGATSQFHAIRIPPELESRRSQLGGNLQIGQPISNYPPAYPTEAAREGIEGTVKLDILVGRDGTVRDVTVLTGPPMLAAAGASAVRSWRYGETFLAGQAIETQRWVTIVFRLAK